MGRRKGAGEMGLLETSGHDHHGEISWSDTFRCGGKDESEDGDAERKDDVQPAFACAVGMPCVCAPIASLAGCSILVRWD